MSRWSPADLAKALSRNPALRLNRSATQNPYKGSHPAPKRPERAANVKEVGFSKYRNQKTEVSGLIFDSKKEATRYLELKVLERAGKIRALAMQPSYDIWANDQRICRYKADFYYIDNETGKPVVEDCKGMRTPVYRLKKKLMLILNGIEIKET